MSVLIVQEDRGVFTMTLNRPEAMNALSRALLADMEAQLSALADDRSARCLIVTGAGDRAFCAGADLKERRAMSEDQARDTVGLIGRVIAQVGALPIPVIAAIGGVALGGGLELALACDLRVASLTTQMGLPETRLAIIPGAGGTQRLARLVGPARAKDLIFTGRRVEAEEALQIGLVDRTVPQSEVLGQAFVLAHEISQGGPIALRAAKQAIDGGLDGSLAEGLCLEQQAYEAVLVTEDRMEGLQAFAERRVPRYQGR